MCKICYNEDFTSDALLIKNCSEIEYISLDNKQSLSFLIIRNCSKLKLITKINQLKYLYIIDCSNINLNLLFNIKRLKHLLIEDCINFHNINTEDKLKIKKYLNINKITHWYKRMKLTKKLKLIIPKILEIYYMPGYKGYYISKQNYNKHISLL